ncbi:hypothetical protein ACLK1T_15305 [Escherichia coli]
MTPIPHNGCRPPKKRRVQPTLVFQVCWRKKMARYLV